MPCLFTYTMTNDSGLAPNPFGGVCKLALCKPIIRRGTVEPGDWVAGVAGCRFGEEKRGRLVYAMKVTQKVTFEAYDALCHEKWDIKIPCKGIDNSQKWVGDCQYCFRAPDGDLQAHCADCRLDCEIGHYSYGRKNKVSGYARQRPGQHGMCCMCTDLSGRFVLISDDYYYFGGESVDLSDGLQSATIGRYSNGKLGVRHRKHGDADCRQFVEWLTSGCFDDFRGQSTPKARPTHFDVVQGQN